MVKGLSRSVASSKERVGSPLRNSGIHCSSGWKVVPLSTGSAASAVAAGAGYLVWWVVDDRLGRGTGAQILSLGLAIAAAIDAYLIACLLLRVREISPLLSLRARVRRRR